MKVSELMTRNPISCRPSDTVRQVARIMRDQEVVLIPVVSDLGRLVGIITDRDLCCRFAAEGSDPDQETIQPYVTPDPITCLADDEVESCERLMRQHAVHRIPVLDGDARCVGILTPLDFLSKPDALVSTELIEALRARIARQG